MTDPGEPIQTGDPNAQADDAGQTGDGPGGAVDAEHDGGGLEFVEDPRSREELLAELAAAEAQRDEYLDDLRRARAEFENFRKRTTRESAGQRGLGRADVVEGLLDVLDDLDRTLGAAEQSDDQQLAKGIELVAGKLVSALGTLGLERVDETGVAFDPTRHEAVQQQPADDPVDHPVVAQVLRPGYRMGERVLRAAMVVVEQ